MGLLRWLRSLIVPEQKATATAHDMAPIIRPLAAAAPQATDLPVSARFTDWKEYGYLGVVGESQYQDALLDILRTGRICEATLIPEPDNKFDVNAIVVKIQSKVVGYIPRSHARRYQRRLLTLAEPLRCPAKLIGGTVEKPHIGVLLDSRAVEHMPTPKRRRKKQQAIDPTDTPF